MTEEEWLNERNAYRLCDHLKTLRAHRTKIGRRKFRLVGCACCRLIWAYFEAEPHCSAVVEGAEKFADGVLSQSDLNRLAGLLSWPHYEGTPDRGQNVTIASFSLVGANAELSATGVAHFCVQAVAVDSNHNAKAIGTAQSQTAMLFRDVFGNPFRPVTFDPAWRTSDVLALAQGIYEERAFDRMPILADALQDAGCDNTDILNHCRDASTPHARGCWVVDAVLGKA